jgi:hypothetical protein
MFWFIQKGKDIQHRSLVGIKPGMLRWHGWHTILYLSLSVSTQHPLMTTQRTTMVITHSLWFYFYLYILFNSSKYMFSTVWFTCILKTQMSY